MLPVLLLLFVGSGCAALIYEIVWFQLLAAGRSARRRCRWACCSARSWAACASAACCCRASSRARHHPLRVYAVLELGIGVLGLLLLFVMPLVGGIYTAWAGDGVGGFLLRGVVAAVCLLPPTLLMGATLPAIARWVETTPEGVSWLGFFYGGNIAGAVVGCLLAGFYLLRVYDMAIATYVAVALNAGRRGDRRSSRREDGLRSAAAGRRRSPTRPSTAPSRRTRRRVYVAIALSGHDARSPPK